MFRALYSEKRVVAEERRARIDNAPLGRFQEAFAGAALGNNYRRPVIGYAADVDALVWRPARPAPPCSTMPRLQPQALRPAGAMRRQAAQPCTAKQRHGVAPQSLRLHVVVRLPCLT